MRDKPAQVAGFNRVKLRPSSPLIDEVPLSQIVMHVDLAVRLFFVFIAYVFANCTVFALEEVLT